MSLFSTDPTTLLTGAAVPSADEVIADCRWTDDPGSCLCAVCLAKALGGDPPTKEQQEVIEADPQQPLLVVAGAGSGKTTTMADRVVWLCANGHVRPDQILGVTFTNKAASGLKKKVTEQLGKLAGSGIIPAEQLITGIAPDQGNQDSHRDAALADLLAPTVSTYNAYANTLIKQYGTLIGIEPYAELGGEARLWQLARSITDRLVRPGHDLPDAEQADAPEVDVAVLLEADRSPRTVTEDLMTMSDQCAEHGRDPQQVADWLDQLLSRRGEPPAEVTALVTMVGTLTYRREIAKLAAYYNQRRREEGLLNYNDQLTGAVDVAQLDRAAQEQRAQYRIVLLDEFQDTSTVQAQLFATLFGQGHSVTAVGDPNQSIYGFRGASAGQLYAFRERFPTAEGTQPGIKYLTTAWRNGPNILIAANRLLGHFGDPGTLQLPWHRSTAEEIASISGPQAPKRLTPSPTRKADNPGVVTLGWYETSAEEADGAVAAIHAAYQRVWERKRRAAEAEGKPFIRPTVAVLARTHRQLDAAAEAFDRQPENHQGHRLAYERTGLSGLLETPEVREVLNYLQVLADPARGDIFIRILAGDKYQIGPRDLYALGRHAARLSRQSGTVQEPEEQRTVLDAVADLVRSRRRTPDGRQQHFDSGVSQEAMGRLEKLWDSLGELQSSAERGLTALVESIIERIGLKSELEAKHAAASFATHQLSSFVHEVETFEANSAQGIALQDFLDWVEVAQEREGGLEPADVEPNPHAVQLMTMHASKGLEWDIVATIGWRAPDFPKWEASEPWTGGGGWLPWPLRGDAENLPRWGSEHAQDSLAGENGGLWLQENCGFSWEEWRCRVDGVPAKLKAELTEPPYLEQLKEFRAEEYRRLAYVTLTRAADELIITGSLFSGTSAGRSRSRKEAARDPKLAPSEFLTEVAQAAGLTEQIAAAAEGFTRIQNPASLYATESVWPYDSLAGRTARRVAEPELAAEHAVAEVEEIRLSGPSRREAVNAAAEAVLAALADPQPVEPNSPRATDWKQETDLVLHRLNAEDQSPAVTEFPEHLSASHVVALGEDAAAMVSRLRRPVPQEPKEAFRRGTQIHEWIEDRLGSIHQPVMEFDGDQDKEALTGVFAHPESQQKFLASPWAQRTAFALEMNFATPISGTVIRGQIDAVYGWDPHQQRYLSLADKDRLDRLRVDERNRRMQQLEWHLVDWKSGRPPQDPAVWEARKIQLAVYRLAFHRMYQIPLEQIVVSFHYVDQGTSGETKTIPHQELPAEEALEQLLETGRRQFSQLVSGRTDQAAS